MTLKPSRLPLRASLGGVSQDREMISGEEAVAWTFSGGRLGTGGGHMTTQGLTGSDKTVQQMAAYDYCILQAPQ